MKGEINMANKLENKNRKSKINKKPKKVKSVEKITKDYNLGELVSKYPQTIEVLLDYGLHCVGCGAMFFDSIEAGAKIHGYTDEEIEELVLRLNEVVEYNE